MNDSSWGQDLDGTSPESSVVASRFIASGDDTSLLLF